MGLERGVFRWLYFWYALKFSDKYAPAMLAQIYFAVLCFHAQIRARGIVLTFPHPSVLHAPCFDSPGHRLDIHKTPHRIRSQNQVALSACTFPVDSPRRSYALVSTRFPQGYRRTGTVFGSLCP